MRFIRIRFNDSKTETRALGFLAGRFSFTSYDTGETVVPANALRVFAKEGIAFSVEGPATYAETIPGFRTAVHKIQ